MTIILQIVNKANGSEDHPDKAFKSFEELTDWVDEVYVDWSSLVITVLP